MMTSSFNDEYAFSTTHWEKWWITFLSNSISNLVSSSLILFKINQR